MEQNNTKKKHYCKYSAILCSAIRLLPKFQQASTELFLNKTDSKEVVSNNMLGNIPVKKQSKKQQITGARWQVVVRSSQFKSADGTATPNQLQTVRVRPIPTTADGESHIPLRRLTSKG